jgi:pyruvate dehydrogenase E2 component (dihydrolipoamide acetyltransferase)
MPTNILMPALSPTMEKGNLAKWLKKEGDKVKSGDVLAEIETDKATMEVEAVDEGTLGKILINAGTNDVAVNTPIAVLLNEGEKASDIKVPTGAPAPRPAAAPVSSGNVITLGAGLNRPAVQMQKSGDRVFASPLAKRLAKQKGIDLSRLNGSGPHGRIVERDVLNAPQPYAGPKRMITDEFIRKLYEPGSYTEIPHDSMRKIIAARLTESKQTIPHFYLTVDCELDALLETRKQMNAAAPKDKDGNPAYKLSVNDYVIKAMAMALHRVPDANVTWMDNIMLKHKHADVGVAVAIPGGLITPIIRKAEVKTLSEISSEMKDLAVRAKGRKLLPHEYQGGSSAISNLGMFGIKEFAAVINPPHATILAIGAGEQRAVVHKGEIVIRTIMTVTLATDHRAVDGALGAELITAFKANIEQPSMMLT